jgi:hypothetical protein
MKNIINIAFITLSLIVFISTVGAQAVFASSQNDLNSIINSTPFYDPSDSSCGATGATGTAAAASLNSVYVLGDSITERSEQQYISSFQQKGVTADVDASSGRSLNGGGTDGNKLSGMQAIAADEAEISQAQAIVIALGTNGGNTAQSINQAISAIRADNTTAPIYWVDTIVVNRPGYVPVIEAANQAIYGQAATDNYAVISWFKTVDPNGNPEELTGAETDTNGYIDPSDSLGVHPTPAGITALTNLVVGAVTGTPTSTTTASSGSCACQASGTTTTATTTGVAASGSTNANGKTAYDYFLGQGYSAIAASGIVGNLMYESGVDPTKGETGGGGGYGIAQFTAKTLTAMETWVTAKGENPNSLQGQLDYLSYALTTNYPTVVAALKTAASPSAAALIVELQYERPQGTVPLPVSGDALSSEQDRENDAAAAYTAFSSDAPTPAPTVTAAVGTTSGCGGTTADTTTPATAAACGTTGASGDVLILCDALQYNGIYYEWGGGHKDYNPTFKAACPNPLDPPDNQPHGGPVNGDPSGASGNPSPCATDCSGLVQVAMSQAFNQNFSISVSSSGVMEGTDASDWQKLSSISQAQPGDVVTLADSTGHVEIVESVSGTNITTFGSHATGQATNADTQPISAWHAAYHWNGPGSSE